MEKANVQFEKAEETHEPKCSNFTSVLVLLFPCPLEALVLWRGEGTSKTKVIMHVLGCRDPARTRFWRENTAVARLLLFFPTERHVCCSQWPAHSADRLEVSRGSREPCAGGRVWWEPDSPCGTAAAHPDAPHSTAQANSCHGELGQNRWGSDARSSILHRKEPGQKMLL